MHAKVSAYDLLEALQEFIEECEDNNIEPNLKVIMQPGYPLTTAFTGYKTDTETGTFTLGVDGGHGYATSKDIEDLDGF